jgi:hypothetical protein
VSAHGNYDDGETPLVSSVKNLPFPVMEKVGMTR